MVDLSSISTAITRPKGRIRIRLGLLFLRLTALAALALAVTRSPFQNWVIEIITNLEIYLLIPIWIGFFLSLLLVGIRNTHVLLLGLLFALMIRPVRELLPFWVPLPQQKIASADIDSFKIFYANVCRSCGDPTKLKNLLAETNPELVVLVEMTPDWVSSMNLSTQYPHFKEIPRDGHFGIAVYSRFPFVNPPLESVGGQLPPVIITELELSSAERLTLYALHSMPPMGNTALHLNKLLVRRVATKIKHEPGRVAVVGDLNATPLSRYYMMLAKAADLTNVQRGYGLHSTWDARNPFKRLPIDHILYKGDLRVKNFTRLPGFDSDHFPLLVEFETS